MGCSQIIKYDLMSVYAKTKLLNGVLLSPNFVSTLTFITTNRPIGAFGMMSQSQYQLLLVKK